MLKHVIGSVVCSAFVVATLASTSSAFAHGTVPYPAPRDIQQDDSLEWMADLVKVEVTTTKSACTVTSTIPEDLNYIYQVEILLFCSDGTQVSLTENNWFLQSDSVTRSCPDGTTFEAAGVTVYALDPTHGDGDDTDL